MRLMSRASKSSGKLSCSRKILQVFIGIVISAVVAGIIGLIVFLIVNNTARVNLIDNPAVTNIKAAISEVDSISDVCIVTEESDLNGSLDKPGGYIDALFFTSEYVQNYSPNSNDACVNGTDGGGSIEIYQSEKEANSRNEYLTSFDGNWGIKAGAHKTVGRIVIRISDYIPASKQNELFSSIEFALKNKKGA